MKLWELHPTFGQKFLSPIEQYCGMSQVDEMRTQIREGPSTIIGQQNGKETMLFLFSSKVFL